MAKILFFGDSITAFRENIVTTSELFAEKYPQHEIVNKGVGGNDTQMARERFQRDVLDEKPDMFIFCFGCNDSAIDVWKEATEPRVSLETYLENLRYFVHEVRAIGSRVIFWTSPPMFMTEILRSYYGKEPYLSKGFNFSLDRYLEAACKLMAEENVELVPVNRIFKDLLGGNEEKLLELLPDGMHPGNDGHKIIFKHLCEAFEKIQQNG